MSDTLRLLLIDDDEDIFVLVRDHFASLSTSWTVGWAPTYERALEALSEPWDTVLVDHHLGLRRGIDLISAMNGRADSPPMILLTASRDADLDVRAMAAGADDFVDKSYLGSELLERSVRHAIERHRSRQMLIRRTSAMHAVLGQLPLIAWTMDRSGHIQWEDAGASVRGGFARDVTRQTFERATARAVRDGFEQHGHIEDVEVAGVVWQLRIGPMLDGAGREVGAVGTALDVTAARRQAMLSALRAAVMSILSASSNVDAAGAPVAMLLAQLPGVVGAAVWWTSGGDRTVQCAVVCRDPSHERALRAACEAAASEVLADDRTRCSVVINGGPDGLAAARRQLGVSAMMTIGSVAGGSSQLVATVLADQAAFDAETVGALAELSAHFQQFAQRVAADAELRTIERGYGSLFERSSDALVVVDDECVCIDANPAARQLLGSRQVAVGSRLLDLLDADSARQLSLVLRDRDQALLRGRVRLVSDGEQRSDIDYIAVPAVHPNRQVLILREVSVKRADGLVTAATQGTFRALLDSVALFALTMGVDGEVTFVNRFLLDRLGSSLDQTVGRPVRDIFPMRAAQAVHEETALAEALANEDITPHWVNSFSGPDGNVVYASWNSTFVRDERGDVVGLISIGEDITGRRELERQLREAVKMESVGHLASGIAHDFNNLLTVIGGHAAMVRRDFELAPRLAGALDSILATVGSAGAITRQLLGFGRQQTFEMDVVSVQEVASGVATMIRPMMTEAITIQVISEAVGDSVWADRAQLEQVLMNLAINARDAMPVGGQLTISIDNDEVDDVRGRSLGLRAGVYVTLTVTDTGTGIPHDIAGRIFEPFFTTKESGAGSGLGLSTVFTIVTQSGGTISVDDGAGGVGAKFVIHLPLVAPASPKESEPPEDPLRHSPGAHSILLVDDNDEIRHLVAEVLRDAGHVVEPCAGADEAVDASDGRFFDLLLTDVIMPNTNGRDLADLLVRRGNVGAVLYMSGYTSDVVDKDDKDVGLDLLAKPFSLDELLRRVTLALERSARL